MESAAATAEQSSSAEGRRTPGWLERLQSDRLDSFCERAILWCVVLTLVLGPLATGATGTSQFLVLLGLGLMILPFWITRVWVRKQYRFLFPPFAWTVIAFAGYAIWRYTEANIEFAARAELVQILLYALLFFAVLDNLSRAESVQVMLFALIAVGVANSFYAIYQYFTDSQWVLWFAKPEIYRGRASGTYICPNHLAGFLELALPVALAFVLTGRFKPLTKVFLGYAAVVMLAGIAVTVSRAGFVSLGAALLVFFAVLLWNRDFRVPAIGALVLLLCVAVFFGQRSFKTQKRFDELKEPQNARALMWKPAVELWKQEPWFGIGAGHYDSQYRPWRHWQLQIRPRYVHNDYLQTLTEYGVVGAGIIGLSLLTLGWGVFRTWKFVRRTNEIATKPSNRSAVVLGCSAGLVAILVHSVPDFNMHIPANAITAVAFMAILVSHWRFATERYWVNPAVLGRLVLTATLVAGGWYLGKELVVGARQQWVLRLDDQPMTFSERLALYEKAHAIDPRNPDVIYWAGELLRQRAFKGEEDYEKWTRQAIGWFEKLLAMDRWNTHIYNRLGMCYHWIGERQRATELFEQSIKLDPIGYEALSHYGWHLFQLGKLEEAREYFMKSVNICPFPNPFAAKYLEIVERRLAEPPIHR